MNKQLIKRALILISVLLVLGNVNPIGTKGSEPQTFSIGDKAFEINGEPFLIKAAELHYPRIPREYWDQRIKMCKALGMNTVCLYTFWNVHESREGEFDFSGQSDIGAFIRLCHDNGLFVILRPGPYVCAEWEMGGLPWWLLKKNEIRLRDSDPYFLERVKIFEKELAKQVAGLTIEKGGPIIMIQVENEYGAYGENKNYVAIIRDYLRELYGPNIVMFQCDWASNFTLNGLDDLVWTMNFGTGADVDSQFGKLKALRPNSPLMCSEFWSGWFDKWGAPHETRPADDMVKGIEEMLEKGISFSLYMTHGGTNWGHWAGANSPGYAPDVTSYDYDAPIDESGHPTHKYWLLRDALQKFSKDSLPKLPELIEPIRLDTFKLTEIAPFWENLTPQIYSPYIKPMESFDQGYGSIMYSTRLPKIDQETTLHVVEPHDYAQVFVDGEFIGKLDRRLGEKELILPKTNRDTRLDILVEAMGRINFGVAIKDFKGITQDSYLSLKSYGADIIAPFDYWEISLFPDELDFYEGMNFQPLDNVSSNQDPRYPRGVYKGSFFVEKPSDTFLNFETWGKGLVYVNGHALGRIWNIGPQQTLYMPGVWLNEGENEILIFDIVGPESAIVWGEKAPVIDKLQGESVAMTSDGNSILDLGNLSPVFGGAFSQKDGWQRQTFERTESGRYLVIETLSPYTPGESIAIAEIYALDDKGQRISRERWRIAYVSSEDKETGNHNADKIYDLQESTFWQASQPDYPQIIIIDMGKEEKVGGIEYLPRVEVSSPGAIKEYKIYVSNDI